MQITDQIVLNKEQVFTFSLTGFKFLCRYLPERPSILKGNI